VEQASGTPAGDGGGQLQALARRRVDHHMVAGRPRHRRAQEGQRVAGDLVEIGQQAPGRAQGGSVELPEAVEGGDLEAFAQPLFGGDRVEAAAPLLVDQFGRAEPRQLGLERARRNRAQLEAAGGDVGGGEPVALAHLRHRHQPVG
jgi:hypothetical protein